MRLMRWSTLAWLWLLGVLLVAQAPRAAVGQEAGRTVIERRTLHEDLYLAGGEVDVWATVEGDVVAAGGRVRVGDRVTGDVLAAGGDVTIEGRVADDVRVAGGVVTVRAEIGGDLAAVGGTVRLPPDAVIEGKAWLAGGEVDARGRVGRWLRAAGRTVRLGGEVAGDVEVVAGRVEVLPGTRIRGALVYRSPQAATIPPGVEIAGGVRYEPAGWPEAGRALRAMAIALAVAALAALLLAAAVLAGFFPAVSAESVRAIRAAPWTSLAVGFAALVATPVAAALLVATVVGAAVGIALFALYVVALLAGLLVGATFVGAFPAGLFRRGSSRGRVLASALVGAAALAVIQLVPVLGTLVAALVLIAGLGGLAIHGYRRYMDSRPV
jgi:hypothetical protein